MIIMFGAVLDLVGKKDRLAGEPPRLRAVVDESGQLHLTNVVRRHLLLLLLLLLLLCLFARSFGSC